MSVLKNLSILYNKIKHEKTCETFEGESSFALKASSHSILGNFVWGKPSGDEINKVQKFFSNSPYVWMSNDIEDAKILSLNGFSNVDYSPEMYFNIENRHAFDIKISIKRVNNEIMFKGWCHLVANIYNQKYEDIYNLIQSYTSLKTCSINIGYLDDKPVATSCAFHDGEHLGIYFLGVEEAARRKGVGEEMTKICLNFGISMGSHNAYLYAINNGRYLYQKLGFKISNDFCSYSKIRGDHALGAAEEPAKIPPSILSSIPVIYLDSSDVK